MNTRSNSTSRGRSDPPGLVAGESGSLFRFCFPGLSAEPGLRHAVFTRHGGVSRGPYAALNTGRGAGDAPECVRENRERIVRAMGGGVPVFLRQRHGSRVATVGDAFPVGPDSDSVDAAVTDRPGRLLFIQVADCQAVILYDPVRAVVANLHSGWRGSVADIIGKTVETMQSRFGSRPAHLRAGISPSLGPCCAEFVHYRSEIPAPLWRYRIGDCHFDFWTMSVDQLKAAGVPERNIEVAGLCTRCRTDLFYSYRGEKITGRFAVVAGLRGEGSRGR